jgi:hypothetical protein
MGYNDNRRPESEIVNFESYYCSFVEKPFGMEKHLFFRIFASVLHVGAAFGLGKVFTEFHFFYPLFTFGKLCFSLAIIH